MAAASDNDAPTLRMMPHESLLSNVFHDSTPMRGRSNAPPPINAGTAGDSRCSQSVSHSASVAASTASVLISAAENGCRFGVDSAAVSPLRSNGPTMARSNSAPPKRSA